jgi:hypothetical protein
MIRKNQLSPEVQADISKGVIAYSRLKWISLSLLILGFGFIYLGFSGVLQ